MKRPDSVPRDLFARATLIRDKRDADLSLEPIKRGATYDRLPNRTEHFESVERASEDRWTLLGIIEDLEAQLKGALSDAKTSAEHAYKQAHEDMLDDGYRPPRPG